MNDDQELIFLVQYFTEPDYEGNYMMLGAFHNREEAERIALAAVELPGFRDFPQGMEVVEVLVGHPQWTEGFDAVPIEGKCVFTRRLRSILERMFRKPV